MTQTNCFDPRIEAELVFAPPDRIYIPVGMGAPAPNQMLGTAHDRLAELSGRVCYDSLGSGRGSQEYHEHIQEVGHLSVYEHLNYRAIIKVFSSSFFASLVSRPGVYVRPRDDDQRAGVVDLTFNLRSLLEWDLQRTPDSDLYLRDILRATTDRFREYTRFDTEVRHAGRPPFELLHSTIAPDWYSFYISGSRGLSHELVRHGDFTAISQRSTRYVDESETEWIEHPLLSLYHNGPRFRASNRVDDICTDTIQDARFTYRLVTSELQSMLMGQGVDKFSARKQARGAARGYLGNALGTALIFSASADEWKHIIELRCSPHADAEIRILAAKILVSLQEINPSEFGDYELVPSPDGIGSVLKQ